MSSDFKALLPGLGILVLLVALGVVVMENIEQVPETRYRGYQGEASYNPYLAMALLLQELGLEVKRLPRLGARDELPYTDGTLFLPGTRATYSESRYDELLAWVELGGHLVATPQNAWHDYEAFGESGDDQDGDRADPLLVRLGVALRDEGANAEEDLVVTDGYAGYVDYSETPFRLPGRDIEVRASIPNRLMVVDGRARWTIGPAKRARLVHRRVGEGGVTLVADEHWMRNVSIGDYEHATLSHFLATLDGRTGPVWVVYGADVPALLELAVERGWPTMLAAAVAILLWLIARGVRFGPRHPVREGVRRSVLEHVEATGRLLWRRGGAPALVGAVKSAVLARAARTALRWEALSVDERRAHVREVAGISSAELERLFGPSNTDDPASFIALVRTLREIDQRL